MGFGSFDESEQEKQELDSEEFEADEGAEDDAKPSEATHDGTVQFKGMDDTDSLLTRLNDIKDTDS